MKSPVHTAAHRVDAPDFPRRRSTPRMCVVLALAALVSLPACAQTHPQPSSQGRSGCPTRKALTLDQVLDFVHRKIPEDRTLQFLESCSVAFPMNAPTLEKLVQAGASERMLDSLNQLTASRLTLDLARSEVAELTTFMQSEPKGAQREAALQKLDADYQAQRSQLANVAPKGPFEPTRDYDARVQRSQAAVEALDRTHQADRAALIAQYEAQATEADTPYRARIAFLEKADYPDSSPATFTHYNPDSGQLTASIGAGAYLFDNVPPKSAQTLYERWKLVQLRQPFADDDLHHRILALPAASIAVSGYSLAAKAELDKRQAEAQAAAKVDAALAKARASLQRSDWDAALQDYRHVLELDPGNAEAQARIPRLETVQKSRAAFLQGLSAAGVWLDPKSGLLWPTKDSDHMENYQGAIDYCEALQLDGLKLWRLPTIQELRTLYDPANGRLNKTMAMIEGRFAYGIVPQIELHNPLIWSSDRAGENEAYRFDFHFGQSAADPFKAKQTWVSGLYMSHHALCVRAYDPATDGLPNVDAEPGAAPPAQPVPLGPPPSAAQAAAFEKQAEELFNQDKSDDAFPLFLRACQGGNQDGCANAGYSYALGAGVPKDSARGISMLNDACDSGSGFGCLHLAAFYQLGQGVPKDMRRANDLFEKGCRENDATACAFAALRYVAGTPTYDGTKPNPAKAREFFAKACSLGDAKACDPQK